jgi:glycosidase
MKKNYILQLWLLAILVMVNWNSTMEAQFIGDRTDFRDETVYFVMTTRFYDGDSSNNTQCWDNQTANAGDPAWRGDFKGLIDRLDYIKALGFTAIWITPVVENASGYDYHGYHASDISKVDHRYESTDVSLQTLIDAVHTKGMKLIIDIVLNHTGNFGEANLCPQFTRDWTANQSDINACMIPKTDVLGTDYASLPGASQYQRRLALMKNTDGVNHDTNNYWHHFGNFNWDNDTRFWAQIAGDCVDLNTENPTVYNYLVKCYGEFIKMGADGFRIDTSGHIERLTFNRAFVPQFEKLAEQYKSKRLNGCPFYMFGEVCARYSSVVYRNQAALSPFFYTWQSPSKYVWSDDASEWVGENLPVSESLTFSNTNPASCEQEYNDNKTDTGQPTSTNAFLSGNDYHAPDYSQASGLNVIDFPMHYNFSNAASAVNIAKSGDNLYNDATYNLVYVDSHDYGPQPNDQIRFNGGTAQWAENLSLMFTFRGIPCIYYGSEIEFRAGKPIDKGPNGPLSDTGRAYYGGYITGDVSTTDFGQYTASGNVAATLDDDLAQHIRRLNMIRAAVPALRKGQYSWDGCTASSGYAFKRRYTSGSTDSYALVTINSGATFTGILNGTYTECVTGKTVTVSNGTLTTDAFTGQGNLRVYVLNGPGKIGEDGKYIYATTPVSKEGNDSYDGQQEAKTDIYQRSDGSTTTDTNLDDLQVYTPAVADNELSVFYEAPASVSTVTAWVWNAGTNFTGGTWPGTSMTLMGKTADGTKKIFKWTYDKTAASVPTGIIFSHAGADQTVDLIYKNNGYYIAGVYDHTVGDGSYTPTPGTPLTDAPHAYFIAPATWTTVYCWAWIDGGTNFTGGSWPGVVCKKVSDGTNGQAIWEWIYDGTATEMPTKIIFGNGGSGTGNQTADLAFVNGGYYNINGATTGIALPAVSALPRLITVYTLDGAEVAKMSSASELTYLLRQGIYIVNGKKMVIR